MEENKKQQAINTPTAIIVAGVLVMVAIFMTRGGGSSATQKDKPLSEQVGVNKKAFDSCLQDSLKDANLQALKSKTDQSANLAMSALPADQRGTPYSVIIGKNGAKTDIQGALPYETVKKLVDEVSANKVTNPYKGQVPAVTADDHIVGNPDAPVVIIEYADLECPYCKRFEPVVKQIVDESNGQVAWVYRHWIIHPGALPKTAAAECVAKLKGNDAFFKYVTLTFDEIQTNDPTTSTNNL